MKYKYNKYNERELNYFNKKIPTMEEVKVNWLTKLIDDYFIWSVIAFMAGATIWIFVKIYQLSLLSNYVRSI